MDDYLFKALTTTTKKDPVMTPNQPSRAAPSTLLPALVTRFVFLKFPLHHRSKGHRMNTLE